MKNSEPMLGHMSIFKNVRKIADANTGCYYELGFHTIHGGPYDPHGYGFFGFQYDGDDRVFYWPRPKTSGTILKGRSRGSVRRKAS